LRTEARGGNVMPIYEYKCENCGEQFEVLQKFSDDPLTECILCSKGPVKKLISASSFILKGAGFYVNDYPSDSRKKAANAEKDKKSSTSSEKSSSNSAKSSEKGTTTTT
jgi:putative FmdB family regulatory protein